MRTWVFVAERFLTSEEAEMAQQELDTFVQGWQSHGTPLEAQAFCFENAVLVIAANEEAAKASGCSIDKITHCIQALGNRLNIDFLNRFKVLVKESNEWNIVRFSRELHTHCISASIASLDEFNEKAGN
jgi:hypothetical protein